MRLGNLIAALEAAPNKEVSVRFGFARPHSDRGDYSEVAFDPAENVSLASMLCHAKSALGATFGGWKGGNYTMDGETACWIAAEGNWDGNGISAQLVNYWMVETGNESAFVTIRDRYS